MNTIREFLASTPDEAPPTEAWLEANKHNMPPMNRGQFARRLRDEVRSLDSATTAEGKYCAALDLSAFLQGPWSARVLVARGMSEAEMALMEDEAKAQRDALAAGVK